MTNQKPQRAIVEIKSADLRLFGSGLLALTLNEIALNHFLRHTTGAVLWLWCNCNCDYDCNCNCNCTCNCNCD